MRRSWRPLDGYDSGRKASRPRRLNMDVVAPTSTPIKLSDSAAVKVKELLSRETPETQLALRVAVQPGGCSGLRYALYFDDQALDGDVRGEVNGAAVVTDKISATYLT